MQELHIFEYAVIRVVPRVEREEFLNVGVILYCRQYNFLRMLYHLDGNRIRALCSKIDLEELQEHLRAFEQISMGDASSSPIARLDLASRFRWLTATRSTIVQSSKTHPGLCIDPSVTLERLYQQLVL